MCYQVHRHTGILVCNNEQSSCRPRHAFTKGTKDSRLAKRACMSTDRGRFNIFCENSNPNSFILESHKMKNNALNAFDPQNQSLTM